MANNEDEIYHLYAPQNLEADTESDRAISDQHGNVIDTTYAKSIDPVFSGVVTISDKMILPDQLSFFDSAGLHISDYDGGFHTLRFFDGDYECPAIDYFAITNRLVANKISMPEDGSIIFATDNAFTLKIENDKMTFQYEDDDERLTYYFNYFDQQYDAPSITSLVIKEAFVLARNRMHVYDSQTGTYKEIIFTGAYKNIAMMSDVAVAVATKQDTLISGTNIKTIAGKSILGSGDLNPTEPIEIEYEDLVELAENDWLMPGQEYMIMNYHTTTAQSNTSTANHDFTIIVKALTISSLSEDAKIGFEHDYYGTSDGYFDDANLNEWKIKYCIRNDASRFAWADEENGTGVIYWMRDEFGNEASYDFKNIIFNVPASFKYIYASIYDYKLLRDTSLDANGYFGWRTATGQKPYGWSNPYCFTSTDAITTSSTIYDDTSGTITVSSYTISDIKNPFSSYTFNYASNNENHDASMLSAQKCHDNHIGKYSKNGILTLNCTIFMLSGAEALQAYDNDIAADNHDNIFIGYDFYENRIGFGFANNQIADQFYHNTIANSCHDNTIGNNCYDNVISNFFYHNEIGNEFHSNNIANNFYSNEIGNDFMSNSIDAMFNNNSIGNSFEENTIGTSFRSNEIGYAFWSNNVGVQFEFNIVGRYIVHCCFTQAITHCKFGINKNTNMYVRYCQFDSGMEYVNLTSNDASGSYSNFIQHVHVCLGVKGTSSRTLAITLPARNLSYETKYVADNSVTIII